MVPCGAVVSRPRGGIPLTTGVTGAGKHEWPLVRPKRKKPVIGRARVLHAIHVMDLEMDRSARSETRLGDAVLNIVRHGLGGDVEDGRLVHIVPEASDPI